MLDDLAVVVADLATEEDELADLLAALDEDDWTVATPAVGWTVRDQIDHLAEGEELAALALTDEDRFAEHLAGLLADLDATLAAMAARAAAQTGAQAFERWQSARRKTLAALRERPPARRVPWVMGPMSAASFASARLMETWAHGQDVYDALHRVRRPTARLRHIARLGVVTRSFSFANRGLELPPEPAVALTAPDGSVWRWGPNDAPERVTGPAEDFCLVVTQRRHLLDTSLEVVGDGARRWMAIAQVFAGPPTDGRPPSR